MKEITFDEAWEEIKSSGEKEKKTLETAEEVSRIMERLVSARIQQNMSQKELAEKTGLKQSAIARTESLRAIPRLDTIVKIANCLGVKIDLEPTPVYSSPFELLVNTAVSETFDNFYHWNNELIVSCSTDKEMSYAAIG